MLIDGICRSDFSLVQEEFEKNFSKRGEIGASVCVIFEGEPVVDLWGGTADQHTKRPWEKDTVSVVFSCTKGAIALCAHMLSDAGELDFNAPVTKYWPEFGKHGKSDIPIRMLLNHQAGLPALRGTISTNEMYNCELIADRVANEKLFWEPGTQHGYHALTFGWLVGEVIRRIAGQSVGVFFSKEVADPLGLDFWIGLPETIEPRVAPVIPAPRNQPVGQEVLIVEPTSITEQVRKNVEVFIENINSRKSHAAEIPAGGGISNARGAR